MATSQFARKTAKAFADKTVEILGAVPIIEVGAAALAIDAELQEVREVLAGLRYTECWCTSHVEGDMPRREDAHDRKCVRARVLWSRLQIEKSDQIQEQEKSNA